ncbi:MAG TPA: lysyl oxidase family protein [Nocardioidaceae bacterium]|nr:lysyl oxidase family protein [Nocardioidaceae bacterium]
MLVVAACAGILAPSAGAATLKPDLSTRHFKHIRLCQEAPDVITKDDACTGSGRTVMRITNQVANRGAGPLEFAADDSPTQPDCNPAPGATDDIIVDQVLYLDDGDGGFERDEDTDFRTRRAGCRYYHPAHDHYHLDGYAKFELRSEKTGKRAARGRKVSFCISDSFPFDLGMLGAPADAYYEITGCEGRESITGTSVGWYDEYIWKISGQEIDVTDVPAGRYCLISEADPGGELREKTTRNNDRGQRIRLDPADAPSNPPGSLDPVSAPVEELSGRCRLGD